MARSPMIRILWRRSLRMVIGVLVLIAAIFIAESFTTLMSRVLANDGSALWLAALLLLKLPEIVDFAMPLALMLGLYFAVTGARDDNELVICAAAGSSWIQIPRFALIVGLTGMVVSLLFATVIKPSSSYVMRMAFYDMELKAIANKLEGDSPANFTRTIDGRAIIATPALTGDGDTLDETRRGNLFVYREENDGTWRFDQADDWRVLDRETDEEIRVELQGFRTFSGGADGVDAPNDTLGGLGLILGPATVQVSNLVVNLQEDEILPIFNRARRGHEQLFLGALSEDAGFQALTQNPSRSLGEVLARALLCPFAALIAVAGAAFAGTGIGRFTALPITTGLVLGFDIVSRAWLRDAAMGPPDAFWWAVFWLAEIAVAVPLVYILMRRERILVPVRGRA